jgi:hypothetical protein
MKPLQQELQAVTLGTPQNFRNLTLTPLLRQRTDESPTYLLADEAMQMGVARVTEVEGGTVPELRFENHSDLPVLLLDGEELVGAKQNRAVNLTILAPARKTIVIPVSCVEAGRWRMETTAFQPSANMMYAAGRAARVRQVTESLRTSGARRSDQGAVWNDISAKAARMDASSPTQAMSAVFEKHTNSVEAYVRAFICLDGQAGVVFSTGGAVGLDLFDRADTMSRVFPKLIRSYALDAIEFDTATPEPAVNDGQKFLDRLSSATTVTEPAIGVGEDVRLSDAGVSGAALWADGRYVHVCAFSEKNHVGWQAPSRLSRPSRRRSGGTDGRR